MRRAARVLAGPHGTCGRGRTHSLSPRSRGPAPPWPGHTPNSTMRSPSFREAPRPAQVLFIWATRARLPFSVASSSSLDAGLQTHTPPDYRPGQGPQAQGQRPSVPGGVANMIKVFSSGSKFTPKFTSSSQQDKGECLLSTISHLEINVKTQSNKRATLHNAVRLTNSNTKNPETC